MPFIIIPKVVYKKNNIGEQRGVEFMKCKYTHLYRQGYLVIVSYMYVYICHSYDERLRKYRELYSSSKKTQGQCMPCHESAYIHWYEFFAQCVNIA